MKRTRKTRKTRSTRRNRGFTLIEILIVVIILGILAAIVIPQFTNASTQAKASSLASELQSLKSQVALYKLQHNDVGPGMNSGSFANADFWTDMTTKTDSTGAAYVAGTSTTGPYGPYFDAPVANPLENANTAVGNVASGFGATDGWEYNPATGEIVGLFNDANNANAEEMTVDGTNQLTAFTQGNPGS